MGTSGLVAGTLGTAPVALADGGRKSIYDNDEEEEQIAPAKPVEKKEEPSAVAEQTKLVGGVQVRSFEGLEKSMGAARKWVIKQIDAGKEGLDNSVQRYLKAERNVTGTVAELKSDKEDFLPGAIYVMVASLSGSILARNRNVLVRGITPIAVGVGAFAYFLPNTFQNTRNLVWKYEQRAPTLADYHIQAENGVNSMVKGVSSAVEDGKQGLENGIHKTRQFIADSTGLQLPDESSSKRNKK